MIAGRRIVVTGGTGGLGTAVVAYLLTQGARVAVSYRGERGWQALQSAHAGAALWGSSADVADDTQAARFVADATLWLGGLDGVAALAGAYAGSGPLTESAEGEWAAMMRANLDSVRAVCRATLPRLSRGGGIVTVSSRLASAGPGAAAYAASKAAVESLTRSLALENAPRGVRVNAIVPRTIDTPSNRAAMPGADRAQWTSPEAIARVVAFLLSADSACVTGAVVPVDLPA
jgi:NAD(P)-dependent dehydrogenase (short-subunit alcohol dehydrogenase family)